jgi:precorrin-2/cobalt-factor-2 C20-methyltransferase
MSARLIGVGVGPGDPELVTIKAVRVLRESDVVVVPVADTGELGRAERTVQAHTDREPIRLAFALTDEGSRAAAWDAAGRAVADHVAAGARTVAFATIGDPNIYSTFTYLAETVRGLVPDLQVETIPGITAMQALAATSNTVLVEGRETLALLPLTAGIDRMRTALDEYDTVVAYKGGRRIREILTAVQEAGRAGTAVYGAAIGLPNEEVRPVLAFDVHGGDEHGGAPYLSTVIATSARPGRGSKL